MTVWAGATRKTSPAEYRCGQYIMTNNFLFRKMETKSFWPNWKLHLICNTCVTQSSRPGKTLPEAAGLSLLSQGHLREGQGHKLQNKQLQICRIPQIHKLAIKISYKSYIINTISAESILCHSYAWFVIPGVIITWRHFILGIQVDYPQLFYI